jgi:RHS repeat-associated protein
MFIRTATLLTLIASLFAPAVATAQVEWGQEYANRIKTRETIAALGPDMFGEQVNLFDGTASFSATDIDIPGNNGLLVSVTRRLSIGSTNNTAIEGLFGDWELSIPHLSNVSVTSSGWQAPPNPAYYWLGAGPSLSYQRCSAPAGTPEIPNTLVNAGNGGGEILQLNANTSPKLVRPIMPGVSWVTKGFWYLGCHPTLASGHPGEGFWAVDPAGNKYTFNWMVRNFYPGFSTPAIKSGAQIIQNRSEIRLYPTRVEDRFGNWVQYNWQGRKLLSIVASDGRRIDFAYGNDDQIVSATAHGKTWTYTYIDSPSAGVGGQLTAATNPDGSSWTYGQNPGPYVMYQPQYRIEWITTPGGDRATQEVEVLEKVTFCSYDHYLSPQVVPFEIRHPSGARGVFSFKTMRHGRTHVPGECQFSWDMNDGADRESQNSHNLYPAFKDVWSLQSKLVDGPGLTAATWQYRYDNLQACIVHMCATNGTPTRKTVTVTQPDGDSTVSTFGKIYGEDEGQLLSVEVRRGTAVVSRTDHTYVSNAEAALMPFPDFVGESLTDYTDPFSTTALRPMRGTLITQDGNTFGNTINSFDAFAGPVSVSKTNNLGYARTEVTDYQHDLAKWVIGAVKRQYNADTSMVISETEFNAQLQPWKTYKFGKLQHVLNYWPDGSINTVTDGRGNTTWIGDYHRGIPRLVGYPITTEAPQGATETTTVSDLGWITSLTDETGAKTCYAYDAMGRLSTITYPSETQTGVCDASRWHPASLTFQRVASDEHGLPAGHWRASRYEGNKHGHVYYDAMWRPILEETFDASDIGGTLSQTVKRYDSSGRLSFQSYPQRGVGNYWDVAQGTRTYYDALDRVVRVEQDSEHGALATTTEYLPGLQIRVTNPRGLQTTTGFMAWDAPGYDLPLWSSQPEGKVIEIARHPRFGWPLQLKQRSADNNVQQVRSYVYDGHAQLCKTIEPETGATVVGYDAASNPVWSASGLTGGNYASTTDCSHAAANTSGRAVTRQYDARNRLTALLFPDGRGNQVWTYEKDGLPKDITTFNDPNNTTPVVNGYTYNKRRMLTQEYSHQPGWYTWNLGYAYDAIGNLASQSYPTGLNIDYAPNALGQATRAGTYATGAQYYPNGALKQFAYGNGIVHTMSQNARQLPERTISSGGVLDYQNYYDRNGNIEHIANNLGAGWDPRDRWMQYDGLDRLTAAGSGSFGGDHWHRFTYDALDNLTSWKLAGVKDYADYVYDANNRLTNIRNTAGATVVGLSYDAQGNLQNKNGQTYEFDYGNRLRGATGKEYYRYDGHGRRVLNWRSPTAAAPNGTLSLSQYSQSGQLMMQWDDQYPKYSENINLAGSVVAIRDIAHPTGAVTVKYQHTDALGSPVAVTNAAGAVIERSDYEPWGAIIGQPNRNGIGYTGHMMDGATGLTYMQQRYYDQSIGRFLSIDPVSAEASTGEHFNRYWYADGNPYKYTDPDGRAVKAIAAAVVACRLISTCRQAVGRTVARAARTVRDAINSRRGTLQRDLPQNKPEPPKGNPHAPGDAPNETVIVRGGVGEKPPTGSTYSGSQGRTIEEAGRGVPNGQVRETTAGRIRESGGEVEVKPEVRPKTGETNYQHVNVREGGRESTLSDVKPNPAPKDQRVK